MKEHHPHFDTDPYDVELQSASTTTHKLIWRSDGNHEFYDTASDPGELTNEYAHGGSALEDCERALESFRRDTGTPKLETGRAAYDDEILDRLRKLGYVE